MLLVVEKSFEYISFLSQVRFRTSSKWLVASNCGIGSPEAAQLEAKRYLLSLLERPSLKATIQEWGMSLIVEMVEGLQ